MDRTNLIYQIKRLFNRPLPSHATPGSVLFAGADSAIKDNNSAFFWDDTNKHLSLVDKNYVPFSGSLNADYKFAVGSNDNVQNNPGTVVTTNHFVGSAFDLKIDGSGASKWYIGQLTQIRLGGNYSGSGQLVGHYILVNNRLHTGTGTPYVSALTASINLEGDATEAVGAIIGSGGGSQVTCPRIVGAKITAQAGHVAPATLNAIEAIATTSGADVVTVGVAKGLLCQLQSYPGNTITDARGISLDGWVGTGVMTTSYGIYADTSIDIGATRWFIYSLSTSPSKFSGDIQLADVNIPLGTATGTKIGTAANQKLGVWGATPIIQPTTAIAAAAFVANTSGIANDTATYGGYTIGQVVAALKSAGWLQ